MALDPTDVHIGYRLGRLFAIFEKVQQEAINPTSTIGDRYFGAASSTPIAVFETLTRLNKQHLSKIRKEKPGRYIYWDEIIMEVNWDIHGNSYPARLSLDEQGRFAIGYYQQKHDLWLSKNDKEKQNVA